MSLRSQLSLSLLCSALLVGCDSPSNSVEEPVTPPPSTAKSTFTGNAIKGVIANGQVDIYAIQNGRKGDHLASGSTTDTGDYSLSWDTAYSGAIMVEISAKRDGEASLMTCDYPSGCGSFESASEHDLNNDGIINFAEKFPLHESFLMKGLAPSDANAFYVTPLTHLIAETVEKEDITDAAINSAMERAANFFGLSLSMFSEKPYDLSNMNHDNINVETLTYTILNASLFGLSSDNNIASALQNLADSALTDATLPYWSDNGEPSMRQFALIGKHVTDELVSIHPGLASTLGQSYANFQRLEVQANSDIANNSLSSQSDDIEKAKQLFTDLRSVMNVVNLQQDEILSTVESISSNAALAEEAIRPALAQMGIAMEQIGNNIQQSNITFPYIGNGFSIEHDQNDNIYHISGTVNNQQINFYYTEQATSVLSYWGCNGMGKRFAISGSVENEQIKVLLNDSYLETECPASIYDDTKGKLSLSVSLIQKTAAMSANQTSPIEFTGDIYIDVERFTDSNYYYYYSGNSESYATFINALSLAGTLSDGNGNSVRIEAHTNALSADYSTYSGSSYSSESYSLNSYTYNSSYNPDTSIISVGLELFGMPSITASVRGVDYNTSYYRYEYSWWGGYIYESHSDYNHFAEDSGLISLEFSNSRLDINMVDLGVFYITNQSGVSLLLNMNNNQDMGVFGITQIGEDAKVLGFIDQSDDGLYMIRYNNGEFETLF